MSTQVYALTAAAWVDLLRICNYLAESASLKVAGKVIARIEAGIRKVARTPELGHRREDLIEWNILFYRVHSYLIVYRPDKNP